MCAYNKVNGEYCSEHHTCSAIFSKMNGDLKGFVVSDWGAVHDLWLAQGRLDLEMPARGPARSGRD